MFTLLFELCLAVHVMVEKRLGSENKTALWQSICFTAEPYTRIQETVAGLPASQGCWLAPQD